MEPEEPEDISARPIDHLSSVAAAIQDMPGAPSMPSGGSSPGGSAPPEAPEHPTLDQRKEPPKETLDQRHGERSRLQLLFS